MRKTDTNLKHENIFIVHLIPAFHVLIVVDLMMWKK